MNLLKVILTLTIACSLPIHGQEWSSRISIVEKNLIEDDVIVRFEKGET